MLLQTYHQAEHFGSKSMWLSQGDGQEIEKNRQKCEWQDGSLKDKILGGLHLPMRTPQLFSDQVSSIIT